MKNFLLPIMILCSSVGVNAQDEQTQQEAPEYNPIAFKEPIKMNRGTFSPADAEAVYLTKEESCKLAKADWGWTDCQSMHSLVFYHTPDIDNILLKTPNSEGYVSFDDWNSGDRQEAIDEIWESYVEGLKSQSAQAGVPISAEKWVVYPTLDQERKTLYYAILMNWDGEPVINISASLFDRKGYIPFDIVPNASEASEETIKSLVLATIDSYKPQETNAYADFVEGDKTAATGVLGVLATLVGVKYGKAAAVGIFAILLALLKKGWIILLLPLVFLKNKLFGNKDEEA